MPKCDSGLKWATLVDPLDQLSNPNVTYICMTHALVTHMLQCNTYIQITYKNSDMEQQLATIDFFILVRRIQNCSSKYIVSCISHQ